MTARARKAVWTQCALRNQKAETSFGYRPKVVPYRRRDDARTVKFINAAFGIGATAEAIAPFLNSASNLEVAERRPSERA